MAAHQAPPSLGFSRQEHGSGLPFPSPKWKVKVKWISSVRLLVTPWTAAHQASPSMGFSRQKYWNGLPLPCLESTLKVHWKWKWKSFSPVRLFVTSRIYSTWNSPGQNTGVSSLSLLQGILPTWGSNTGLPHCRWILYQLSHKENSKVHFSPKISKSEALKFYYLERHQFLAFLRLFKYKL